MHDRTRRLDAGAGRVWLPVTVCAAAQPGLDREAAGRGSGARTHAGARPTRSVEQQHGAPSRSERSCESASSRTTMTSPSAPDESVSHRAPAGECLGLFLKPVRSPAVHSRDGMPCGCCSGSCRASGLSTPLGVVATTTDSLLAPDSRRALTGAGRSRRLGPGRRAGSAARRRESCGRGGPSARRASRRSARRGRRRCGGGRASAGRGGSAASRAGYQTLYSVAGAMCSPCLAGKSRASLPRSTCSARCWRTVGIRWGGIATSRVPASVFGVPTMNSPRTLTTALRILTTPFTRSMSLRRSSVSSPNRIAHQAASSSISR